MVLAVRFCPPAPHRASKEALFFWTGIKPSVAALQIAGAAKKYGERFDAMLAAATIAGNPDRQYEVAERGTSAGQLTKKGVRDAIRNTLVTGGKMTPEEARKVEAADNASRFVSLLGELKKRSRTLLEERLKKEVIEIFRARRGRSDSPEVIREKIRVLLGSLSRKSSSNA